jgi:hypothetical protein
VGEAIGAAIVTCSLSVRVVSGTEVAPCPKSRGSVSPVATRYVCATEFANAMGDKGLGMVPYSEVKARWGNGKLYLWLYAADLDLQGKVRDADAELSGDDAFQVQIGSSERFYTFEVNVLGTLTDAICKSRRRTPHDPMGKTCDRSWQSGTDVDADVDGTLNQLGDKDEEWVVELTIPLDKIGRKNLKPGTRVRFSVSRCEVAYDGVRACGSWGLGEQVGELLLDP